MLGKNHRIRDFLRAKKLDAHLNAELEMQAGSPVSSKNQGGEGFATWIKDDILHHLPPAGIRFYFLYKSL